jgi:4-hydroxybenzoyl-CoA thioesterase
MIFSRRYRIRFGEINGTGIACYPALLHYFQRCFDDWWSEGLGTPYAQVMREEHFSLPIVGFLADFGAPIHYGDEPDASLGVARLATSTLELGFWLAVAGRPGAACRARISTVAVDTRTMRKQPIPEAWRSRFAQFDLGADEFPNHHP